MKFESPEYAILILLIIFMIIRLIYLYKWKQNAKRAFADRKMAQKLFQFSNIKQFGFSNFLLVLIVLSLILALMDPSTPGDKVKTEVKGSDVVYCLDLSNSMNAEDIMPSRLDKAKQVIRAALNKTISDRVGLVVFAYDGYVLIPLTQSYDAIDSELDAIQTSNIVNQGTRYAEAIKAAAKVFKNNDQTSKNVVFISDGEDHAEDIDETIKIANENKLNIITVGVGTSKGSVIPETKNYQDTGLLLDENKSPVISKLNEKSLRELAADTGGTFIYADSAEQTAEQIVMALKTNEKKGTFLQDAYLANHYFQWILVIALIFTIILSLTNIQTEFNI